MKPVKDKGQNLYTYKEGQERQTRDGKFTKREKLLLAVWLTCL